MPEWQYAYGGPCWKGVLRSVPEDFQVDEYLSFEPSGSGEHVFVQIRKRSENTEYIARELARFCGVRQRDVSYAGLKDRHAVTTQWFSIWLPGKADPDWSVWQQPNCEVLQHTRHARKLKRGVIAYNQFRLRIRDWQGDRNAVEHRLTQIQQQGFPNYFGEQRFGHQGKNLQQALSMFQGQRVKPEQRSIYLSALRAFLFNEVLSKRIADKTWLNPLDGDVLMFADSHSYFKIDVLDKGILDRMVSGDLNITGPLWGRGILATDGAARELESKLTLDYPEYCLGLEQADLEPDRRALCVRPKELCWQWLDEGRLELYFCLPAGSYATALLREFLEF